MYLVNINREFKFILLLILKGIQLHQKIGFFYDLNAIDDFYKRREYKFKLKTFFSQFYNCSFFSDYIGGFITNYAGNINRKLKLYSFVIFLNFDYLNPRHRSLFQELKYANIECVLISIDYVDIIGLAPFIVMKMNLNDLNALHIFLFYLQNYINLHLKKSRKKYLIQKAIVKKEIYYLFNSIYLLCLLKNKKILKYTIKNFFSMHLKINYKNLLKALLFPTDYKMKFFDKLAKHNIKPEEVKISHLLLYKNKIKLLLKKLKNILLRKKYKKKKKIIKKKKLKSILVKKKYKKKNDKF